MTPGFYLHFGRLPYTYFLPANEILKPVKNDLKREMGNGKSEKRRLNSENMSASFSFFFRAIPLPTIHLRLYKQIQ